MKPTVTCIIPARLESTRFPRKMLALLNGIPLIEYTWRVARSVPLFDHVIVATDSPEIISLIENAGGKTIHTSPHCRSATERIVEIATTKKHASDIWVNWQGDEPFITADMITQLLRNIQPTASCVWTLKKLITSTEELKSPNTVKVVSNIRDEALYFSRSLIPYHKHPTLHHQYFKHVGLYAYTNAALAQIATQQPCTLEEYEQLEQLRWLYYGIPITAHTTTHDCIGINTPQDLDHAHAHLARNLPHVSHVS